MINNDSRVGATVASGLNTAWLRKQKSRKRHAVEVAEKMDDEAALSTRPDFPPSPKFDRKAANIQLAKANLDKHNPARKNMVCLPYVVIILSILNLIILACLSCLRRQRQL